MSELIPEQIARRVAQQLDRFGADMKRQGIHVGISVGADSTPVRCVACGAPWPCQGDDEEAGDA